MLVGNYGALPSTMAKFVCLFVCLQDKSIATLGTMVEGSASKHRTRNAHADLEADKAESSSSSCKLFPMHP